MSSKNPVESSPMLSTSAQSEHVDFRALRYNASRRNKRAAENYLKSPKYRVTELGMREEVKADERNNTDRNEISINDESQVLDLKQQVARNLTQNKCNLQCDSAERLSMAHFDNEGAMTHSHDSNVDDTIEDEVSNWDGYNNIGYCNVFRIHEENDNDESDVDDDNYSANMTFRIDDKIKTMLVPNTFRKDVTDLFIILQCLALTVRGKLTYDSLIAVFRLIKSFIINSALPTTKKSLWKMLSRNDAVSSRRHWYCQICRAHLGTGENPASNCQCYESICPGMNEKKKSYFIQLKIEPQLQQLFSDSAVVESLEYRFKRRKLQENNMEDIYDSAKYREFCKPGGFLTKKYNFSLSLFTDGVRVSNSSNASAWPIMLMINEFPPHARKKHMLLAGIWVDEVHPNLQTLLKPTVNELKSLYQQGMVWTNTITKEKITSKFVTVIMTADSKARAPILNMNQGNGIYGCTYCYHKGEKLNLSRGVARIYPNEEEPSARRTDHEIRTHMKEAHRTQKKIYGVQNVAAVALIPQFNLSSGAPVDSMHNVYLGVAKFHTKLLLDGKATDTWYCGSPQIIAIINERLLKIRPPSRISRKPRPDEEMSQWKASEWRNWILFYAVPCLNGIINKKYVALVALMSRAVYILNMDSISINELKNARIALKTYVKKFEEMFGKRHMRFNIHLLNHLADSVEEWGPFWTHSAFPYEAFNKEITDDVTSATSRCLQIVTRYTLKEFIEISLMSPNLIIAEKKNINETLTEGLKKKDYIIDSNRPKSDIFQGLKKITIRAPSDDVLRALSLEGYAPPATVCLHQNAIIRGTMRYTCEPEKKNTETRYCNKYIFSQNLGYCVIKQIITFRNNHDSIINGFIVDRLLILQYLNMEHIHIVKTSARRFLACNENVTIVPAIELRVLKPKRTNRNLLIVSKLSNVWETD